MNNFCDGDSELREFKGIVEKKLKPVETFLKKRFCFFDEDEMIREIVLNRRKKKRKKKDSMQRAIERIVRKEMKKKSKRRKR